MFCLAATAIAGLNLATISSSVALQESELEDSAISSDEAGQYPDVSDDGNQVDSEVNGEIGPDTQLEDTEIEFEDDRLIIEQENGEEREIIDLSTVRFD
ncbi:MAG: hypothetical protein AAGI69_05685 [Cyanobacteria bacterium P01_H01_bin.21]